MPRKARIIIPGVPHHIVQRGNNRQKIIDTPDDLKFYCYWVNKYREKYHVSILAYCLMSNHVHFVVVPKDNQGISRLFNIVHMRYAQYMHHKRKSSGHLWQGRFYSCIMDDDHLYHGIRYVEQNPVRANIVKYPWDYKWSSARLHLNIPVSSFIKIQKCSIVKEQDWRKYLLKKNSVLDEELRKNTYKCKAFANDKFISFWEKKLDCVLRSVKRGRKRKNRAL